MECREELLEQLPQLILEEQAALDRDLTLEGLTDVHSCSRFPHQHLFKEDPDGGSALDGCVT